jgi:hypothetical protein
MIASIRCKIGQVEDMRGCARMKERGSDQKWAARSPHGVGIDNECRWYLTRVNLTNVLDEGLRIGETGHRMNSKVESVKQGGYRK